MGIVEVAQTLARTRPRRFLEQAPQVTVSVNTCEDGNASHQLLDSFTFHCSSVVPDEVWLL